MFSLDEVEVTCPSCLEDVLVPMEQPFECPHCGAEIEWDEDDIIVHLP